MGNYVEVALAGGGRMRAYHAEATAGASHPGLVIIQEIFGVNANMRETAEVFSAQGYDVIVPDLFWRQEAGVELDPSSAADRERATALSSSLDQEQAVRDCLAAVAHLSSASRSSGQVGAVGYCLGGKLAYLLAMRAEISAAVSYYGVAINTVLDRADNLSAPLLLHIALEDHLCSREAQAAIHDILGRRDNVEIADHPHVGHAFARLGATTYVAEAAEKANAATMAFLARHLGPA